MALRVNRGAFVNHIRDHETASNLQADANDAFVLFTMAAKTSAAALSVINRENYHEVETRLLKDKVNELELLMGEKLNMYEALNRVADGVGGNIGSSYDREKTYERVQSSAGADCIHRRPE